MELREIYETLLRRGMPEHDELEWRGSEDFGIGVWVFNKSEPISFGNGPMFMGERYARDLITMHALRWVNSFPLSMKLKCAHYCLGAATESLEDILLTTIPLEPKKTLA